ncbi:MAG TPA: hypothetical protein VE991_09125 [Acidimicrobiales bacterium]|nr:hypothetical protein [Acidimicrobiales bacterium]
MSYVTAAQLLDTLGVTSPSAQQTADASAAVAAATMAIDNLCQRPGTPTRDGFGVDADALQVRYYSPARWDRLPIDDLVQLTSLQTRDDGVDIDTQDGGATTWTLNTDFVLQPENAAAAGWPYTHVQVVPAGAYTLNVVYPRSVKITGKWGWPATPQAVVDACTLIAERLYKMKREGPLGVVAFQQEVVRVASADRNVMLLLAPYMRMRVIA